MISTFWKRLLVVAVLAACCSAAAFAQQASAQAPAQAKAADDDEEMFDEKLRQFGYWSGAAFACVGEAKQAEVERKVLDTFNGIARLFGTDRAFFYAAAFGNGTTHKVDPAKCPEFLDKFQKATAVTGGKK
jgi:type II secretory pathway pseudopilin PulG